MANDDDRVRTVEEIRERLPALRADDPFGFTLEDLRRYLPEAHVAGATPDDPPTRGDMRRRIVEYLPFAFEKAINHRGLSAMRSVEHLRNWAWLGGFDELLAFVTDGNYRYYGMPILKRFAAAFEVEIPAAAASWPDGEPCWSGCDEGCGS